MVREFSVRKKFRDPRSLFNYRREKSRVDINKSLAKLGRPQYQRIIWDRSIRWNSQNDVERDYSGSRDIPFYVMLPLGIINIECELVDPDGLLNQLRKLKSIKVDGVVIDTWWGIVEANNPKQYNWKGYKQLFSILRKLGLKIQVVLSFHECGGDVGDDVHIPLPKWIKEIGQENPDIYFTDRDGRRNPETLSWGIDEEPVLRGRTAVQVYQEYMRSFRDEFDEFLQDKTIAEIEIGLGPCGELRYPSYPAKIGWEHPGIGEFQCYDKYLRKCLEKAAKARGHSSWGRPPDNAGSYNSQPQDTKFFCDGGDYDSEYGRFFLTWYSQYLIDHGDRVLAMAIVVFEGVPATVSVKLSGMHWGYETATREAAELTAGFYIQGDGFAPIVSMLKKHRAVLNFTWSTLYQHEAMDHPVWKVVNAAWDADVLVSCETALPCYDRKGYNKILDLSKPRGARYKHLHAFTYRRLNQALLEKDNFKEFKRFLRRMHGEVDKDLLKWNG